MKDTTQAILTMIQAQPKVEQELLWNALNNGFTSVKQVQNNSKTLTREEKDKRKEKRLALKQEKSRILYKNICEMLNRRARAYQKKRREQEEKKLREGI